MVVFGPSGSSDFAEREKLTRKEYADRLISLGLKTYEHPFTFGVRIKDSTIEELKDYFIGAGISISVHAPYYINFASSDDVQILKSNKYLLDSVLKAREIGASRVVFHPGSLTGLTREQALQNVLTNLKNFISILDKEGINDIYICPETMGKHGQIGTPQEVYAMCKIDSRIIPTLDFGHINAFTLGGLKTVEDYDSIFDMFIKELGKTEIHIHFSRIEYTGKGEKRHLTFDDESDFGPDYKAFLESIKKYDANFRVVSESAGTQDIDSKIMLDYFEK